MEEHHVHNHHKIVDKRPTKRIHSARWRVFNRLTEWEFAECTVCGHEQPKPYPTWCPKCHRLMADKEYVE